MFNLSPILNYLCKYQMIIMLYFLSIEESKNSIQYIKYKLLLTKNDIKVKSRTQIQF